MTGIDIRDVPVGGVERRKDEFFFQPCLGWWPQSFSFIVVPIGHSYKGSDVLHKNDRDGTS